MYSKFLVAIVTLLSLSAIAENQRSGAFCNMTVEEYRDRYDAIESNMDMAVNSLDVSAFRKAVRSKVNLENCRDVKHMSDLQAAIASGGVDKEMCLSYAEITSISSDQCIGLK